MQTHISIMRTERKLITGHGQTTRDANSLQQKDTGEFLQTIASIELT